MTPEDLVALADELGVNQHRKYGHGCGLYVKDAASDIGVSIIWNEHAYRGENEVEIWIEGDEEPDRYVPIEAVANMLRKFTKEQAP